ncbi:MAG: hypothetical protein Edafosvirus1_128 [Edafosvirus sp.]|uniref:Tyrosine specific protein phosphatases domain-containing protein n=1 Tax=Edafosvirus sp. TaxID=2487765 RepID=A0A3G4ZSC8_9VIRU|nr:MAG: hypothetical protein Edafosvirus1_128 [Edafosvirus sp.]
MGTGKSSDIPLLSEKQKMILPKVNAIASNIYMGAYPGAVSEDVTKNMQKVLCQELGITHFVCLMDKEQLKRFTPYKLDEKTKLIHFEIIDQRIAMDDLVVDLIRSLIEIVENPTNKLYIHCWGGNGRTSTIATILLSKLYKWDWDKALTHIFKCYLQRKDPIMAYLPETEEQLIQIERLCDGPMISFEKWREQCKSLKN